MDETELDRTGIDVDVAPSGDGCVECERDGGWWFHLRRCARCGHVGCCDDSLGAHATAHHAATGHPVITSFEPGEDWFFDYRTQGMAVGAELHAPHSHPASQAVPGPADRVPDDWQERLGAG